MAVKKIAPASQVCDNVFCYAIQLFRKGEDLNSSEMIAELKQYAGFSEVYHKTLFGCVRQDKNGNTQEVEVCISDCGPDVDDLYRYRCVATSKDGKMATGNPESSVDLALMHVHWEHLDGDPYTG